MVRIQGVPDLAGMSEPDRSDSLLVFEHVVGTYKRVRRLTSDGLLELLFSIRRGPAAGLHVVEIEPRLVRVRRPIQETQSTGEPRSTA